MSCSDIVPKENYDDSKIESIVTVNVGQPLASSSDVASYASDMLSSLVKLANNSNLNVLALMLTMARDQADDDAGKPETKREQAAS